MGTEDAAVTLRHFQAMCWKNFIVFLAKYKWIHRPSEAYFKNTLLSPVLKPLQPTGPFSTTGSWAVVGSAR